MSKAIEFKQIKKVYGEKTVIEGFDLTVERGEFVTVIGSSGCGKTTVLKMVNGLVIPDGGSIFVEGRGYLRDGYDQPEKKYRLCHPGKRFVSAYDGGRKYLLCS